jgi:hypothetical protein
VIFSIHCRSGRRSTGVVAPLRAAVDDLLVGQHRPEGGAPVDGLGVLVGEPPLEQLEEDPLGPADVVRVRGVDLPRPVVAETEHLQLAAEGGDVLDRRDAGVRSGVDGPLLRGQAEGVPAHGVEHPEALGPLEAGDDVAGRVALRVPDVQARPGRVGEHVEDVVLRLGRVLVGPEGVLPLPVGLPLRLDLGGLVAFRHGAVT